MNERIQELIKQSTTIEYGADRGFDRVTFDKEKFAELILEEVAIVASTLSNYYSKKLLYAETDAERDLEHRAGAACIHVMVDVKKHFGQDPNDIRRYFDKPAELNK